MLCEPSQFSRQRHKGIGALRQLEPHDGDAQAAMSQETGIHLRHDFELFAWQGAKTSISLLQSCTQHCSSY